MRLCSEYLRITTLVPCDPFNNNIITVITGHSTSIITHTVVLPCPLIVKLLILLIFTLLVVRPWQMLC